MMLKREKLHHSKNWIDLSGIDWHKFSKHKTEIEEKEINYHLLWKMLITDCTLAELS